MNNLILLNNLATTAAPTVVNISNIQTDANGNIVIGGIIGGADNTGLIVNGKVVQGTKDADITNIGSIAPAPSNTTKPADKPDTTTSTSGTSATTTTKTDASTSTNKPIHVTQKVDSTVYTLSCDNTDGTLNSITSCKKYADKSTASD